jgi:uncharacterized protein (TIGR00255 family)
MKSMTGFGRTGHKSGKKTTVAELDIAIKSVNGRYFEVRMHMPREFAGLETEFKAALGELFSRGTLDVYVNRVRHAIVPEIEVNTALAKKWLDSYRALGRTLKLDADASLEMITRIPDVLRVQEESTLSEAERREAIKALKAAAEACDKERQREGKSLQATLTSLCSNLDQLVTKMEAMRTEANAELERRYRERLRVYLEREGLQNLGFKENVDDHRIAQEIVIQLDRADISEELTRLKEHLKAYRQLLSSDEPQGKKLDFYAQELLREVNTIGSKSQIAKLTALVVEAKTLVEKIREQVQNVE